MTQWLPQIKSCRQILLGKMMVSKEMKTLHISIPDVTNGISISIFDSEIYHNALVVQPLIGNLVVSTNQGRIEPSLAESWSVSESHIWTFKLRPNLSAENGEKITAESFKKSLERSLRWQAENSFVPVFENLLGFQEFRAGAKAITGIKAHENSLVFEFVKPFRTGLLEYLAMAPFGFIADANFKNDGTWADDNKFISSGPYKLKYFSKFSSATLEKNNNWYKEIPNAAKTVLISEKPPEPNSNALHIIPIEGIFGISQDLVKMNRIPEDIYPIVLLPRKHSYFENENNRKFFKAKLLEKLDQKKIPQGQVLKSVFFLSSPEFSYRSG